MEKLRMKYLVLRKTEPNTATIVHIIIKESCRAEGAQETEYPDRLYEQP